jgi:hypothetical protein
MGKSLRAGLGGHKIDNARVVYRRLFELEKLLALRKGKSVRGAVAEVSAQFLFCFSVVSDRERSRFSAADEFR